MIQAIVTEVMRAVVRTLLIFVLAPAASAVPQDMPIKPPVQRIQKITAPETEAPKAILARTTKPQTAPPKPKAKK